MNEKGRAAEIERKYHAQIVIRIPSITHKEGIRYSERHTCYKQQNKR